MPISEDEYDFRQGQEAQSTMSKAELRKTHKPIMEKRRRARINHSLNEIKSLILEAMKKDPARHSKLEKADILEMAVKHLQNVQRQQLAMAMASDPSVLRKFKSGFNDCAGEVGRYVSQIDGVDQTMQQRIAGHLNKCINGIEQIAQFNFPGFGNLPFLNYTSPSSSSNPALSPPSLGDQNNNPPPIHRLQLIPSRLPTGEFALLLPNSSNLPYFQSVPPPAPNQNPNQRPSAFAKVIPSSQNFPDTKPLSPPLSPPNQSDVILVAAESYPRNPSPQGFRPVNPTQRTHTFVSSTSSSMPSSSIPSSIIKQDLQQVPQVTSTQTELKQIKYPIHAYSSSSEKDRKPSSPNKRFAEPLCIITNQSERYKQAQVKEETALCEENVRRGVKRAHPEQQGLLAVAYCDLPQPKVAKIQPEPNTKNPVAAKIQPEPSSGTRNPVQKSCLQEEKPSTSKGGCEEGNSDMWRPW